MTSTHFLLRVCAGQRRHPTRLFLTELATWLAVGGEGTGARIVDFNFVWRGGFPSLNVQIDARQGCSAFKRLLITWSETTLDQILFKYPWDESPLLVEPLARDGHLNIIDVQLQTLDVAQRLPDLPVALVEALSAAVLHTGLTDLTGSKQVLPVLLGEAICGENMSLPSLDLNLHFDAHQRDLLTQQKHKLAAAGRLSARFSALEEPLRKRYETLRLLLNLVLVQLPQESMEVYLRALLNRCGYSPRESDYLLYLAMPETAPALAS